MKRILLIALFAAGLVVGSCRRQPVQPEFDVILTDTVILQNGIPCTFQYAFTSIGNRAKSPALQAIQEANIGYFYGIEEYGVGTKEAADISIGRFLQEYIGEHEVSEMFSGIDMEMTVDSDARVVDSLLVYTISRSYYTGGAHGMYSTDSHNYSLAGGYELALSDLFDAGQRQALVELIRMKLYEKYGVTGDEGLAALGFFPENITTTENFEVTDRGIVFHYNPYDIGSYALGGVEVLVTDEEIDNLK